MKKYNGLVVAIVTFENKDVVTSSGDTYVKWDWSYESDGGYFFE